MVNGIKKIFKTDDSISFKDSKGNEVAKIEYDENTKTLFIYTKKNGDASPTDIYIDCNKNVHIDCRNLIIRDMTTSESTLRQYIEKVVKEMKEE